MVRSMSDRKAQEWWQRLVRFENSRHTINGFCRQEGVSPQSIFGENALPNLLLLDILVSKGSFFSESLED